MRARGLPTSTPAPGWEERTALLSPPAQLQASKQASRRQMRGSCLSCLHIPLWPQRTLCTPLAPPSWPLSPIKASTTQSGVQLPPRQSYQRERAPRRQLHSAPLFPVRLASSADLSAIPTLYAAGPMDLWHWQDSLKSLSTSSGFEAGAPYVGNCVVCCTYSGCA